MEFKEKLKARRKELKLTQQEVADAINVSRSVIAKWETGLVIPKEEMFISLAAFLKVEVTDLVTDNIEPLLVQKNKSIRNKLFVIYSLVIVLLLLLIGVLDYFRTWNLEDPIVTNIVLDEKIPVLENTYYLTSNDEYELYFEVLVKERTFKLKPNFYVLESIGNGIRPKSNPVLLSKENIDSKTLKLKYKASIYVAGYYEKNIKVSILWNFDGDPTSGFVCDSQCNNVFRINSSWESTVDVNFYYVNKLIYTYKLEKGRSLRDVLDDEFYEQPFNLVLNYELYIFFMDPYAYPNNGAQYLLDYGFEGWVREDGGSLDEPIFEEVNLIPMFPFRGDCSFLTINNKVQYGLYDYYLAPLFYIDDERTVNIKYTISSESEIVSIVDNKYKLIDYGVAEITVEYDLGFYKGTRTFVVKCEMQN